MAETHRPPADWRSYDPIAATYDRIHASRFGGPGRDLVALAMPPGATSVLDAGTGSGFAAQQAIQILGERGLVVGLDLSLAMLRLALRRGVRNLACGEASRLPFRDASFDAAMANFVLSHFSRPPEVLSELARVVRPGGRVAATAWGAGIRELGQLWREVAQPFIDVELDRAEREGVPSEELLTDPGNFRRVLEDAGLSDPQIEMRSYPVIQSLDDYLSGRETTFAARLLRRHIDGTDWKELRRRLEAEFSRRFTDTIRLTDSVLLAVGTRRGNS